MNTQVPLRVRLGLLLAGWLLLLWAAFTPAHSIFADIGGFGMMLAAGGLTILHVSARADRSPGHRDRHHRDRHTERS